MLSIVEGAQSYNVYYAKEPGVTKSNYLSLIGGGILQNNSTNKVVNGSFENGQKYYFVASAVDPYEKETSLSDQKSFIINNWPGTLFLPSTSYYNRMGVDGFVDSNGDVYLEVSEDASGALIRTLHKISYLGSVEWSISKIKNSDFSLTEDDKIFIASDINQSDSFEIELKDKDNVSLWNIDIKGSDWLSDSPQMAPRFSYSNNNQIEIIVNKIANNVYTNHGVIKIDMTGNVISSAPTIDTFSYDFINPTFYSSSIETSGVLPIYSQSITIDGLNATIINKFFAKNGNEYSVAYFLDTLEKNKIAISSPDGGEPYTYVGLNGYDVIGSIDLITDDQNNIYITGSVTNDNGLSTHGIFILLDSSYNVVRQEIIGDLGFNTNPRVILLDYNNDIYISGKSSGIDGLRVPPSNNSFATQSAFIKKFIVR